MHRFSLVPLLAAASAFAAPASQPPKAPVRPVTDDYFGTQVIDNYRWMETSSNAELAAWMKEQNDYTRGVLNSIPGRNALLRRVETLDNTGVDVDNVVRRGQRYFYEKIAAGEQIPKLFFRDGIKGKERLAIDPAILSKGSKTHYALDYFVPSWNGRYLAYGISAGGSEQSVLHVLDVDSGKTLAEAIDRTHYGRIAWQPDDRSFFYMRHNKPTPNTPPAETEYNARTYLHTVNAHANGDDDPVVFGRGVSAHVDVPPAQGTYIVLTPDSPYAIAVVNRNMDENPSALFAAPLAKISNSHTPWRKIADFDDGINQFDLHGDDLYLLSQKDASRRKVLRTSVANPDIAHADIVVPQSQAVLTDLAHTKNGLVVRERDGAVSRLHLLSWDGKQSRVLPLPFEGTVRDPATDPREADVLFAMAGWFQPKRWFNYDPATDASSDAGLVPPLDLGIAALEAKEVFATSYDGTRIPLSLVYKKGLQLDGRRPTYLGGYGSYGNSIEPFFNPGILAWVERGGVLAIAHVRGGGEYGEDWHAAGQKQTKLNTIFDFIACAEYLIDQHYTSSKSLVGYGGSAGGIMVGGALTWRPDLFGVILDDVGLSDALRMETTPNGPPNVPEFGSVKTEQGFHGLFAMSAYAHVRDGTAYPATLFTTGANDPRVASWIVAKMAARTQAATSSDRPVLLRVDYDAGHGLGSTRLQKNEELVDKLSFALWQIGDPDFQPK